MKILIAGDYCPHHRVGSLIERHHFDAVFGDIRNIIGGADYAIVNFESSVTNGGERPIEKCGPNLHCSEQALEALKWAGFHCVTLANNHFYDFGDDGVGNTLDACEKNCIEHVGGGRCIQDAAKILYRKIENITLAIINCCEHEFSIATEVSGGSNPLNPIQQYYAIQEAKQRADYVLVIVHGGHEYYKLPSPRMQESYRFFVDVGADAVVNHHQHCYSGYELYKGKPIFYGLGNFCFDWDGMKTQVWHEGFLLCLNFDQSLAMEFHPYVQCAEIPTVRLMNNSERLMFEDDIKRLNEIIADKERLAACFDSFCNTLYNDMRISMMPYSNRYVRALCNRHVIPSFINKKRKLLLYNYIVCESHKDVITDYLHSDEI